MKKGLQIFLFGVLFICASQKASSQNYFNKLHDDPFLFSSVMERDSGYIIIGDIFAPINREIAILKLNQQGDTTWQKILGAYPQVHGSKKIIPFGNGFAITGTVKDTAFAPDVDFILAAFDGNGDSLWYKRFGGPIQEVPSQMQQTSDGGFIIVGTTDSYGFGLGDFYLVKTDSIGNFLWQKTYGGAGNDIAYSVIETPDSGFIISGHSESFGTSYDIFIVKTDSSGNMLWQKTYGGSQTDYGGQMKLLSDNHFLVNKNTDDGAGTTIAKVMKIDPTGNVVWEQNYPYNSYSEFGLTPIENSDGTFIVGGFGVNTVNTPIGYILKTDPLGNVLWQREYFTRTDIPQYIYDIKPTADSGFVFCGSAFPDSSGAQQHAWVVKLDCFGCDSNLCYYNDSACYIYDCTLYSIDAFFTASADTVDLAFGATVTFTNTSLNTSARAWDFGDDSTGYTTAIKTHTYTTTGNYTVSLIVYHGMCTDTFSRQITVISTIGIDENDFRNSYFNIYPNPSAEDVTIEYNLYTNNNSATINVSDVTGKILKTIAITGKTGKIYLNNYDLDAGIYFVSLVNDKEKINSQRLVIIK